MNEEKKVPLGVISKTIKLAEHSLGDQGELEQMIKKELRTVDANLLKKVSLAQLVLVM